MKNSLCKKLLCICALFSFSALASPQDARISGNQDALGQIITLLCQNLVEKAAATSTVAPENMEAAKKQSFESCVDYLIVGLKPSKLSSL